MNFFKKKIIPSGETVEITEYERWSVRWTSIDNRSTCGNDYATPRKEANFFTSEEDAKLFKEQLKQAQSLLKQKVYNKIEIIKED